MSSYGVKWSASLSAWIFLASGKTIARSETTLRSHSNYVKAFLWACSIVAMLYINARSASRRQLIVLLLTLLCCGIYRRFNFTESYFTIHSLFAPKIADTIILYARKVLKTFNHHLNRKREFTGKTLRDHFWCSIRKFNTLFSIIYSWYNAL